jgi:hypothetical protein
MAKSGDDVTVSVLLPTYNRAGYIAQAIDSLLAQTCRPFEIIVLDDGSSDDTASVCTKYKQDVIYVGLPENRGKTAAINHGLAMARGEFIWIMDDDDIAPPHALRTLLAPLISDASLGFSFGALRKFRTGRRGQKIFERQTKPDAIAPRALFVHLMEDCFITGQPCVLFRRDSLMSLAPFDEAVLSSVDYNIILEVARRRAGIDVKSVVLWQRQHAGSRGPASMRYNASARADRWRESDKKLIARLLPQLSPGEYLGIHDRAAAMTPIEIRKAYLQKAVIAGRKELWTDAAESLRIGLGILPDEPLSPEGATILSRMFGSRYGIDAFLGDVDAQRDIAAIFRQNALGEQVSLAACSQLPFWFKYQIRRARFGAAIRVLAAMGRLAGRAGALHLVLGTMQRKLRSGALPGLPAAKTAKTT